jgi:short-subunit dehydrogenase
MFKGQKQYGSWALVAGAAEGLGEAFSTVLAMAGINLVMADIKAAPLEKLASLLATTYGVRTEPLVIDLSEENAWMRCMEKISGHDCRLLVWNAAYSHVRPFTEHSHEVLDKFVNVNARNVIHLVSAFVSSMSNEKMSNEQWGGAGILLMSSLSGVIAPPLVAPYAATKAFNIKLAESLFYELKPLNIRISACTAGITSTPKFWESKPVFGRFKPQIMDGMSVATYALKNLGRRPAITPGWQNRLSYFLLTRILPGSLSLKIVSRAMRKMYPDR